MRLMAQNNDCNTQRVKKLLVSACDFIMLNACIIAVWFGFAFSNTILLVMLLINAAAIIGLRQWLCHYMQIPWLYSPFNRFLKRGTDILLAITSLLCIIPVLFILQAFCIKKNKGGAVLQSCRVETEDGYAFKALKFRKNFFSDKWHLGLTPLAINILWGNISIWDLRTISRIECPNEEDTETGNPINDCISENDADETDTTIENRATTASIECTMSDTSDKTIISENNFIDDENI